MTIYDSVRKGIDFIEANLENDIGVLDVAKYVSFSQFYFSREFSRYTHISVYDYIIKRKISEAYKYLFADNPKIVDVALRFGFQSHEVFTRAFRKVFGENPSEISVFKPLAVYERIDEYYLQFLSGLRTELVNKPVKECFFEANSMMELGGEGSFLVMLQNEHLQGCKGIFGGRLKSGEDQFLSYGLCNLKHKIRVYHNDAKYSFRYFVDNHYDVNEMRSNFILIKNENCYIDIFIPTFT